MSADDGTDGCLVAGTRRQPGARPGPGKERQGRAGQPRDATGTQGRIGILLAKDSGRNEGEDARAMR